MKNTFDGLLHSCILAPPMCEWEAVAAREFIPTIWENRAGMPPSLK